MKQLQVGLVVEGNATASIVLRLSSLTRELGPVKSAGLQVARRISNFLNAGYGIGEYQELETARLVLLKLPDAEIPRAVAELSQAALPFSEMSFVLCESWLPTVVLEPLRLRGANVASVVASGSVPANCLFLEGDKPAVRRIKRLVERAGLRALELKAGSKPLLFAANLLLTAIPVPIFQLSQQTLRESGIGGNDLSSLMTDWTEILASRARKGGRATWGGPLTECSPHVADEHFRAIREQYPAMAAVLEEWLILAKRQMLGRARSHSA